MNHQKNDNHKQKMEYTQIVVDKNIIHPPNNFDPICAQICFNYFNSSYFIFITLL